MKIKGRGHYAEVFEGFFIASMKRTGFVNHYPDLSTELFKIPKGQMKLFR